MLFFLTTRHLPAHTVNKFAKNKLFISKFKHYEIKNNCLFIMVFSRNFIGTSLLPRKIRYRYSLFADLTTRRHRLVNRLVYTRQYG